MPCMPCMPCMLASCRVDLGSPANGQFIRNPTLPTDCPNDGFVPKLAISVPLQGDREPMSECPELENRKKGAERP
jgi:hypothetical protein